MWQQEMVDRLNAAKGKRGAASSVMHEYQVLTGKSRQQLYRIAKKHGYHAGRKKRSDMGECKLTERQILWIGAQIHTTAREVKGAITPVAKALQDAEDNGIIEPGTISVSRLTAILNEKGINKAALETPSPHTQMRSLHPNHTHLFDMSVCIQFYLKGRLRMMDERKFYKNKYANYTKIRRKLIRYVLVDHFSGTIFTKYYYTGGETQENLFDFLCDAWASGKHEKWPFRGVPFFVLMDAGAANTSKAILRLLQNLEIKIPNALPHNPRRQGAVEVTQNIVERWFESSLRIQPATSMEQLNDWALDWAVWFNATKRHSRHGMTRTQCWLAIRPEQLREMPDRSVLQDLYAEPEKLCAVRGDYTIRFENRYYSLKHIEGLVPGRSRVLVVKRPYSFPELLIRHDDSEYPVSPIAMADGGFRSDAAVIGEEFKAVPESRTDRAKKVMDNMAYGEERPKDAAPFEGITVMGNKADKVAMTPIPKRGVPHVASRHAEELEAREISMMEFFKRLRPVIGSISPDLNRTLREKYGTSVSLAETNRLISAARDGDLRAAIEDDHSGDPAAANFG